jgi:hypothetical protein
MAGTNEDPLPDTGEGPVVGTGDASVGKTS